MCRPTSVAVMRRLRSTGTSGTTSSKKAASTATTAPGSAAGGNMSRLDHVHCCQLASTFTQLLKSGHQAAVSAVCISSRLRLFTSIQPPLLLLIDHSASLKIVLCMLCCAILSSNNGAMHCRRRQHQECYHGCSVTTMHMVHGQFPSFLALRHCLPCLACAACITFLTKGQ